MAPLCFLLHLHFKNVFARFFFFLSFCFLCYCFFSPIPVGVPGELQRARRAAEVTVTDGKREARCHRQKESVCVKEREREKKKTSSLVKNECSSRNCREAL